MHPPSKVTLSVKIIRLKIRGTCDSMIIRFLQTKEIWQKKEGGIVGTDKAAKRFTASGTVASNR